jgi:hypothetical protein
MSYQVWTKGDEYSGWQRKDCPDLKTAMAELLAAIKAGKEPVLTEEVNYEVGIRVKEGKLDEVKESETESDQSAGGKGHGKIRRGDAKAAEGLDKGSGDNSAGPGAGDKQ